jgi:hypothetical protein
MTIYEIVSGIKPRPHGHVDNQVAAKLTERVRRPIETLDDLHEINGLVARAIHLNNPPESQDDMPPDGGSAAPMAMAA